MNWIIRDVLLYQLDYSRCIIVSTGFIRDVLLILCDNIIVCSIEITGKSSLQKLWIHTEETKTKKNTWRT